MSYIKLCRVDAVLAREPCFAEMLAHGSVTVTSRMGISRRFSSLTVSVADALAQKGVNTVTCPKALILMEAACFTRYASAKAIDHFQKRRKSVKPLPAKPPFKLLPWFLPWFSSQTHVGLSTWTRAANETCLKRAITHLTTNPPIHES